MRLTGNFRGLQLIFTFLLLLHTAAAQQGGQGGGSGGTSNPKTPAPPPTITPTPAPSNQPDFRMPEQRFPETIFLSGVVMMDDGSPPPMDTTIERDCSGYVKKEVYVDASGNFSFQIGGESVNRSSIPDASQGLYSDPLDREIFGSNRMGGSFGIRSLASRLMGCEIRANLAGYKSTVFRLTENVLIGHIDAGALVLYPINRIKGTTESGKNLLAPKAAKKDLEKARKAFKKEKYDEAENYLLSAVKIYPDYVDAWFMLGRLHQQQDRNDLAQDDFTKAIVADELFIEPYVWLAQLHFIKGNWQEVADITDQAMELDPISYPVGYFLNGVAYYHLEELDQAEKSAQQGLRLDSMHRIPQIHLLLANIYSKRQDRDQSIKEMRNYLKYSPDGAEANEVRSKLEVLEKLSESASTDPTPQ